MSDSEIRKLLENVTIPPSTRCWNAIESNLAAGVSSSVINHATHTSKHIAHVKFSTMSLASKILIGAFVTTVITGILLVVYFTSPKVPHSSIAKNPSSESIYTDSSITSAIDSLPTSVEISNQFIEDTTNNISTESQVINEYVATDIEQATPDIFNLSTTNSSFSSNTTSTPVPSSSEQTISTSTATPTPPAPDLPLEIHNHDDPVILNHSEELSADNFAAPITIIIPNVITPNGDGYNDFFVIQGIEQCDQTRLIIQNSNRMIVFQTTNYQNNWGGEHLPDGTYFYQFYYTIHGIKEVRNGCLTIMRSR